MTSWLVSMTPDEFITTLGPTSVKVKMIPAWAGAEATATNAEAAASFRNLFKIGSLKVLLKCCDYTTGRIAAILVP